jgi:hypothetical protein
MKQMSSVRILFSLDLCGHAKKKKKKKNSNKKIKDIKKKKLFICVYLN